MNAKPRILIARAISPEVVERLSQHFEVQSNQDDVAWSQPELIAQLQGKDGVLTTGSQTINAELLAACPQLKIVANMAVGYNNFDVPAMTAAGVQGTNAPDVLTETTADFGFALLMATARRITESEHFLRAGQWKDWRYDLFAG
ncbi:MAG: D-glycerate dehydrogenase, partial [Comamonas sp.]